MNDMIEKMKESLIGLGEEDAEKLMRLKNNQYRSGEPTISDKAYDGMMRVGAFLYPNNSWFNQQEVEPEPELVAGKTVKLPQRMLSTDKAYSLKEIEKWANNVIAVGKSLDVDDVFFRVTPKLDGFAAYDDGEKLYTRGDGRSGTDITRAINNGLYASGREEGPGEIVVNKKYFAEYLASDYENSRNIIAGVIKEGAIDEKIKDAMALGMIQFKPFPNLAGRKCKVDELLSDLEEMWDDVAENFLYDTDGLVIEAVSPKIKEAMGATNHHHRWQIAYKKNSEYHDIEVTGLIWQTSKNGRLTPVVQLEPTKVSGVTISKATGHNWGNVFQKRINTGAIVRVCRSGLVIPYIESVLKPASKPVTYTPDNCPSCNSLTGIDGDNLLCTNTEDCPAQIEGIIRFFFDTLGNIDGFGPKIIEQLVAAKINTVKDVYYMFDSDFDRIVGGATGRNLFNEIEASMKRPIEDWRFLAAFSIHNVGKGGCERLLKHHRLADVFNLTADDIVAIDGFAHKTANSLVSSLARIKPQFDSLMTLGFNLIQTPLDSEKPVSTNPIAGKTVVFTGSMQQSGRADMEKQAKSLGAKVGSSVSSKTDYLVIGANVGAAKTQAAEKHGVKVITEADYLDLLAA